MNILTLALLVASAAGPAAEAGERPTGAASSTRPAQPASSGMGGPYEPVDEAAELPAITVEGQSRRSWETGPAPRLEQRYAPRTRQPVNRIVIRF